MNRSRLPPVWVNCPILEARYAARGESAYRDVNLNPRRIWLLASNALPVIREWPSLPADDLLMGPVRRARATCFLPEPIWDALSDATHRLTTPYGELMVRSHFGGWIAYRDGWPLTWFRRDKFVFFIARRCKIGRVGPYARFWG